MSSKNNTVDVVDNYNTVYEYAKKSMADSQLKLNDSGNDFLEKLAAAINSDDCKNNIPLTTDGLPPFHAEVKYKPADGLRRKRIDDNSFILLTPMMFFVIMKHEGDVYALTYPITKSLPTEDDIRIMSITLVDIGTSILNQINQTTTSKA